MKRKELKTVRFNIRLTVKERDDLKEAAVRLGRSVSAVVREGIEMVTRKALGDRKEDRQMEQGSGEAQG